MRRSREVARAAFACVLLAMGASCGRDKTPAAPAPAPEVKPEEFPPLSPNETAARTWCIQCHVFPEPALLDKKTWAGVLPFMGPRMGIFSHRGENYPIELGGQPENGAGFPAQPMIGEGVWQQIIDYYEDAAPENLPGQVRDAEPVPGPGPFRAEAPAPERARRPPAIVSFLKIDPGNRSLWVADHAVSSVRVLDQRLQPVGAMFGAGSVTWMHCADWTAAGPRPVLWTTAGVLHPGIETTGAAQEAVLSSTGTPAAPPDTVLSSLQRPMSVLPCDLDQDGRRDFLVCAFGHLTGELSWMQSGTAKRVLRAQPGCAKAIVEDFTGDGRPDVLALFSQGAEGLFLFTNEGGGRFSERTLLTFPPVQGSSAFELADFDGDGRRDLLHVSGDNADYSQTLKPWHGLTIFRDTGGLTFEKWWFYPVHGASKAMPADFDLDGDLDLLSIAFFADFAGQPGEALLYFENVPGAGPPCFRPVSLPWASLGRWLTLDTGDIDGDGDIDAAIGHFGMNLGNIAAPGMAERWAKSPPVLLLRNLSLPRGGQSAPGTNGQK